MSPAHESGQTVAVIGDGDLSDEVAAALEAGGAKVRRLRQPDEDEIREALDDSVTSVTVVGREDPFVLRMALFVRSVSEEVPLLLTIFDETMAEQVTREIKNTRVTSLAEIVAPSLAGPCLDERAVAVDVEGDRPVLLVDSRRIGPRRSRARCSPPTTRAQAYFCMARSVWLQSS